MRDMEIKEFQSALARRGFRPVNDDPRNGFHGKMNDGTSRTFVVGPKQLRTRRQTLKALIEIRKEVEDTPPLTPEELEHIQSINRYLQRI